MWFVEIDGEPAGFGVLLPNLNDAIRDLNGRLLPVRLGQAAVAAEGGTGVQRGRVPLMGVKRKFARDPRGRLAPFVMLDAIRRGRDSSSASPRREYSWILEDNRPMRHILEALRRAHLQDLSDLREAFGPSPRRGELTATGT